MVFTGDGELGFDSGEGKTTTSHRNPISGRHAPITVSADVLCSSWNSAIVIVHACGAADVVHR